MSNKTLILGLNSKFNVEKHPLPEVKPNEALIAIHFVGICGSDLHFWHDRHVGDFVMDKPHILGHESAGTVVKVGEDVKNVKPGDRVCLEPQVPCWRCFPCRSGRYNYCPDIQIKSIPPYQGFLREYCVHPADSLYKLPENVSLQEGALMEPLGIAIHACKRANVGIGKKILIFGAGSVGLLSLLYCKAVGASSVIVTDLRESRLETAKNLGADKVILSQTKDSKVLAKQALDAQGGKFDIVLDCIGAEIAVQTGLQVTRMGGVVLIVGLPPGNANISILDIVLNEIDVIGSFLSVHCFPDAISLVSSGKVNLKPLMTHTFKIEEADKAFETAFNGSDGAVKVMLTPNQS